MEAGYWGGMNTFFMTMVVGHAMPAGQSPFLSGLSHPVMGLDHLLAMVAVGLLAARGNASVQWQVTGAFLGGMVLGGVLGLFPVLSEPLELGIVLSMTVFGLILVLNQPGLKRCLPGIAGGFALFHGHAHVLAGPEGGALMSYGAGFVLGTVALMAAGVLVGFICREVPKGSWGFRLAGLAVLGMSLVFLCV